MRVKLLVEQGEPFNPMIIVTFGMLSCHQDVNEAASKYTGTMGIGQDRPIPAAPLGKNPEAPQFQGKQSGCYSDTR